MLKLTMKTTCAVCLLLALNMDRVQADFITLYDGSGLPADQPWLFFAADNAFTQTATASGVRLATNTATKAGYSNHIPLLGFKNSAFPSLDRTNGFELAFQLSIVAETHANNDRAGFSVILLGSDKRGIELGFWGNEIWAQQSSPIFTHGEGATITTSGLRNYRVQIVNDTYVLLDDSGLVLSGAVRDYTQFGGIPYTLANYIFLGDDTSSAAADILLGPVTLQSNLTAVPEPTSFLLLAVALGSTALGSTALGRMIKRSLWKRLSPLNQ